MWYHWAAHFGRLKKEPRDSDRRISGLWIQATYLFEGECPEVMLSLYVQLRGRNQQQYSLMGEETAIYRGNWHQVGSSITRETTCKYIGSIKLRGLYGHVSEAGPDGAGDVQRAREQSSRTTWPYKYSNYLLRRDFMDLANHLIMSPYPRLQIFHSGVTVS